MAKTSPEISIKIGVDTREVKTGTDKVATDFASAYVKIKKEMAAVTVKMRELAQQSRLGVNVRQDAKAIAAQQVALRNELAATISKYKELATVSQARTTLRLTPHADIAAEIAKAKQAYADLAASGKLSLRELAQAKVALREKITDLKEATNGWKSSLEKIRMEFVGIAAVAAPTVLAIKEAIGFESAMVGVKKVVEATPAEFAALRAQLVGLTREIPMTATELAQLAVAGGQIGLAGKDIESFTKLAAKMGFTFDMTAQEAGDAVGKIKNSYNMTIPEVEKFADTINRLGNTTATNERLITEVLLRIGGSSQMFKLPTDGAAALAAGMLSLGMPAEVASTAINAMLLKMQTGEKQGPKFQEALKEIGTSVEELAAKIKADPQAALDGLLDTLAEVEGTKRAGILVDLFGLEHGDEIARLVTGLNTYKEAQASLMDQTKVAGGMEREFQEKMKSTQAQLDLMKNAWREVGITLGSVFLPIVKTVAGWLTSVLTTVADIVREFPRLSAGLVTLASGFAVFGTLKKAVDIAKLALLSFAGKPVAALEAVGGALQKVSGLTLGPWATKIGEAFTAVSKRVPSLIAKVFGPIGTAIATWQAAKLFGGWLGQFDAVQQGMLALIYSMDRVQLAAQKMWAQLTGTDADVSAVKKKIAIARQAYDEESEAIRQGRGAGERKKEEKEAPSPPPPRQEEGEQKKNESYRTTEYLDGLDERVLSPKELEDRKKRWAEREQQEQAFNDEKNTRLDAVAKANAEKDAEKAAEREAIRQADAKRRADKNSVYYKPEPREESKKESEQSEETTTIRPATIDEQNAFQRANARATDAEKERADRARTAGESFDDALKKVRTADERDAKRKARRSSEGNSGSSSADLIREEIKEILAAREEDTNELLQGSHTLDEFDQKHSVISLRAAARYSAKAAERKQAIMETLRGENEKNRQAEQDAAAKGEVFIGKRAVAEFDPAIAALEKKAHEEEMNAKRVGMGTAAELAQKNKNIEIERKAFKEAAEAKKQGILTAQKAAEVEYQARLRMANLDKEMTDEARQRNEELAESARESAADRLKAEEDATAKAKSIFEKYAERVKTLQDEIAGRERSLADELSDLDPHATEELRWRRKAKAAKDYEKAARAAMAAGRLEDAQAYSDQAKTAYAGLKDGGGNIGDKLAGRTAFSGVKSAGTLGLQISKMISDAASKAAKSGISGIDGLNSRVAAQLQKAVGSLGDTIPNVTANSGHVPKMPVQVHEIRLGKARLQGSADDVSDFIRQLELAGLRA